MRLLQVPRRKRTRKKVQRYNGTNARTMVNTLVLWRWYLSVLCGSPTQPVQVHGPSLLTLFCPALPLLPRCLALSFSHPHPFPRPGQKASSFHSFLVPNSPLLLPFLGINSSQPFLSYPPQSSALPLLLASSRETKPSTPQSLQTFHSSPSPGHPNETVRPVHSRASSLTLQPSQKRDREPTNPSLQF